jgi:hypothetical protein
VKSKSFEALVSHSCSLRLSGFTSFSAKWTTQRRSEA